MDRVIRILEQSKPWLIDHGIKILAIIIGAYIVHLVFVILIERAVRRFVKSTKGQDESGEEKRENTLIKIFHGTVHVIIIISAILMILSEVGVNIAPLIAGAGIIGLAVGFGGQYLIKDIITGLFIILENQYRVGDKVDIGGLSGKVEDITLRVTVLRDNDGVVHHVPHGAIATVSNRSKGFSKINVDVGISYSADIDKAIRVINSTGKTLSEDSKWKGIIISPPEFFRVEALADSAVVIKITGETRPGEQKNVASEVRKRVKQAFDKEGIEIPFPQMVIHKRE